MIRSTITLAAAILMVISTCHAQEDSAWQKLKPFFAPPQQFAGVYGNYANPLLFYNGRKVKSRKAWSQRRAEILNTWTTMMGAWPPLIEHPSFELTDSVQRENFTQYTIRFQWRPDESTTGYLLVPAGDSPRAAVVTVFYEPGSAIGLGKPHVDFAYQLARRGFISLSVGVPAVATKRPFAQYYPDYEHASVQPLSMLAYLAANCWNLLASMKNVDSTRIGIVGLSYGSKWAMFASCLYDKFACAAWSDGGIVFDNKRPNVNYWAPWYLGYYPPPWSEHSDQPDSAKGLYPELLRKGFQLTDLHALMAPRPFLVSGGSEDSITRWIPLNQTVRLNSFLGYKNRVGMTSRAEHIPDDASNEKVWEFFAYFLHQRQ